MFGKLIKHEFDSTAHAMSWIYLAGAATFAVMLLAFLFKVKMIMNVSYFVMIVIAALVMVVTVITVVVLFYKSLYGAQGYLSFTLPVTGKQLLASKMIVAAIWIIIGFAFMVAAIAFLAAYRVAQASVNSKEMIESIYQILHEFGKLPDKSTMITAAVMVVIAAIFVAVFVVIRISAVSSIANTKFGSKGSPIGMAIVFYVIADVINFILYAVGCLIPVYFVIGDGAAHVAMGLETVPDMALPIPLFMPLFMLLYHIVLYVLTGNIMNKHISVR